jgi:hypothetical protein
MPRTSSRGMSKEEFLTGLPRALHRLGAVAGIASRALIVRGGACAVCAAAGRARAATPRPREDAAALPIRRRPRTARPRLPLRTIRRLRATCIAAGRRGARARARGGVAFLAVARLPIGVIRRRPRPNRPRRTHHRRRGSLAGGAARSGCSGGEK